MKPSDYPDERTDMEVQAVTVTVPAPLRFEANADDWITNARRAAFGGAAVQVGSPDYGQNGADADGVTTDGADAIANVLHWLEAQGGDVSLALDRARRNYEAESAGE